ETRCRTHERPVTEAPAARSVDHGAVLGTTRIRVDLPGRRGGGHEHRAGGGPGPAQRLEVSAYRRRAARLLHAERRLPVARVVRGCMLEAQLTQVRLEP